MGSGLMDKLKATEAKLEASRKETEAAKEQIVELQDMVKDVTFTNNLVRHVGQGINMLGSDWPNPSGTTERAVWELEKGGLKELFDQLHDMTDTDEVVRVSAQHDVDFLPPKE